MVRFHEHLPLKGARNTVEWVDVCSFDWGAGLTGRLRLILFTADGGIDSVLEMDVHLIRGEDLGVDMDVVHTALEAWADRIRGLDPGQVRALDPDSLSPWAPQEAEALEAQYETYRAKVLGDASEAEARRTKALERGFAEAPRLEEHIRTVWGLHPPPLGFLWGLFLSLEELHPSVREAPDLRPGGVLDRLKPGGWSRIVPEGLDERLHIRFRSDPPEFLSFGWGGSDGLHFGLGFHDARRYAGVVANYARDSAETWLCGPHTLDGFRHRWAYDPPAADATGFADRAFLEELAWFAEQEARADVPVAPMPQGELLGGPMCDPPATLPGSIHERAQMYRSDPDGTRALLQLVQEDPAMALALGREPRPQRCPHRRPVRGSVRRVARQAGHAQRHQLLRKRRARRFLGCLERFDPEGEGRSGRRTRDPARWLGRTGEHLAEHRDRVPALVGRATRQKLVQHRAQRVHVRAGVERSSTFPRACSGAI